MCSVKGVMVSWKSGQGSAMGFGFWFGFGSGGFELPILGELLSPFSFLPSPVLPSTLPCETVAGTCTTGQTKMRGPPRCHTQPGHQFSHQPLSHQQLSCS
jgi:hypothetical protein